MPFWEEAALGLAEVRKHRIDQLKCLVDLLTNLRASQDDFTGHEDQEDDLGLHHPVDQTRKKLWFVRAEHVMTARQTFETNGKFDVARSDDILDLEVGEFGIEAELLDDTRVLPRSKLAVIFRLCTGNDHLARGKDEGGSFRLTNSHDDGRETLQSVNKTTHRNAMTRGKQGMSSPLDCIPRYERAAQSSSGPADNQD